MKIIKWLIDHYHRHEIFYLLLIIIIEIACLISLIYPVVFNPLGLYPSGSCEIGLMK